jgi:hypothetical protein
MPRIWFPDVPELFQPQGSGAADAGPILPFTPFKATPFIRCKSRHSGGDGCVAGAAVGVLR